MYIKRHLEEEVLKASKQYPVVMFSDKAVWIAANEEISAPVIYKNFTVKEFDNAEIKISGLGYYELFINGKRVGNEFFKPAFSDYCSRDFSSLLYPLPDKTSHTIYFNVYNIASYLKEGENVVAVMLGNGFYRQNGRVAEGSLEFGKELILCFEITYGSTGKSYRVFTDGTEKAGRGYITFNNLYYGETHDYTRFSGDIFTAHEKYGIFPVKKIPAPKAKYLLQKCPNDKIIRKLKPAEVGRTDGGIIYDAGENISGFVSFVSAGEDVFIKHAENIKNGSLDFTSAGGEGQISETAYFSAKKGTSVHPFFCWSGFRYFEVKGRAEQIEVNVVHADIAVTSKFFCGNETLNRLYDIYIRTQLNNMHGGIPSDCPHRERLGYTGDGQLVCESAMLLTNARGFFEKWTRDIADCQDIVTGHVQHTAPFCGGGGGPGGWGGAMVLVPYYHYKLFGDKAFVKKYFRNGLKYIESMERFLDGGLVVREMPGGWCLGDWCTPGKVLLPESFVNTYFYIKCMRALEYLGRETDEYVDFAERIEKSLSAITEKYYDSENNTYCGGVQGADAFALSLGIGNKAMKDALIERYSLSGKPDTGIFGTDVLFAYLAENGEADLLFKLFTATEYPSFGYMLKNGATTLWEDWDGKTSHDHPMFGACVKQIFYGILGVKLYPSENKVVLAPRYVEGMGTAEFSLSVCGGNFSAKYRYSGGKVKITVKERIGVTVMIE